MIPRIFEGQPVIIVAGGPSLKGFQFERLAGKNVIAINRAYEDCPFAPMLWWSDCRFWNWHHEALLAHRAPYKATCNVGYHSGHHLHPSVHRYTVTGNYGFDDRPNCVRDGNNSAHASMHTSIHLGASMLLLLGLDMRHVDGQAHYHSGHPVRHDEACLKDYQLPYFKGLVAPLAARNIPVLNGSIDSALDLWPRCSINEGLEAYEKAMAAPKGQGHQCEHALPFRQPLISIPSSP